MRILLIEDEAKIARFVEQGLEAERYSVDVAADGKTALQFFGEGGYDLAIVDLNLPDISGNEIVRRIRRSKSPMPILILTARDGIRDKIKSFDDGADDYLTKPFSFTELALRVKALLRRCPTLQSLDVLQTADLVLNRQTHEVRRKDRLVALTTKEFALLEYLMMNVGRVLSRALIMKNVWDQSFEGVTNVIDVYVAQLRKKVDQANEEALIRTVRGVGYGIREEVQ